MGGGGHLATDVARKMTIDDAPLNGFHVRVAAYTTGGFFIDGYILGMIGIALVQIGPQLGLGSVWTGLIGASALAGIFFGAPLFGWVTDRVGRQTMYVIDLLVFLVASIAQFFVEGALALLVLRLVMGIAIGADYAIGGALLSEFLPKKQRGTLLACLNAIWTVGFVAAYVVGYFLQELGPEAWRWMLVSSAVPTAIVLALRLGTPESPRWLLSKGRVEEARSVVREYIHPDADIDDLVAEQAELEGRAERDTGYRRLLSGDLRRRTAFAGLFWFCQVVPYFAIFTFLPTVLEGLGVSGRFSSEILLNLFLFAGAIAGVVVMDMMGRRFFTIGSFVILAALGALLGLFPSAPVGVILVLFAAFAFVIAAAADLESVYPAEIFPTELRASGVGLAAGISRIGAALGTFLLPISVAELGTGATMLAATAVLLLGAVISYAWAPETRNVALAEAAGNRRSVEKVAGRA
jgi:MFS transporter, putative metabolite transport protein